MREDQTDRRRFLRHTVALGAGALLANRVQAQATKTGSDASSPSASSARADAGRAAADAGAAASAPAEPSHPSLVLPPLPYAQNALEPAISANTLSFHYGKHHKAYFDKTNTLVEGTPFKGKSLEDIVRGSAKAKTQQKLFNNAAQAWNHNFYWQSMRPKSGGAPTGAVLERINKDFGSYDAFKSKFTETAVDHFSNGWVWLVLDKGKLKIVDTHDADTPLVRGQKPLAVSDVWEHAYYLDYKNARKDYVTAYLDKLLNWSFVEQNLSAT